MTSFPRHRTGPLALVAAGLALTAYPALRPWSDADATDPDAVAAAFADPRWPVSHLLGMAGFVLVAVALHRLCRPAGAWAWTGAALVLPYYGAEAFALHALGRYAVGSADSSVLTVADDFRYAALPMIGFGLGWLGLGVAGVLVIRHWWPTGGAARVAALMAGTGLLTYLPQFFASPAGRVAHGVLLGLALVLLGGHELRAVPARMQH